MWLNEGLPLRILPALLTFLIIAGWSSGTLGQDSPDAPDRANLADLIEAMAGDAGRTFLIDNQVDPMVTIAQVDPSEIDYDLFLHVLSNNGLAAVYGNNLVRIIPVAQVRQYSMPVIESENDAIHDEEWVTWMHFLDNADAASVVPVLRPMVPAEGHLAAEQAMNAIVVVDRYANARRIVTLAREMDDGTPSR